MALPPLRLDLNTSEQTSNYSGIGGGGAGGMMPWNNIKNYSNHSSGTNQNAAATASEGLAGGLNINLILLACAAYLILRK
jgi:hypothetical protein